ncbi:MAG: alpha-2-macroglobulin family protein [Pirellulales bacterium]
MMVNSNSPRCSEFADTLWVGALETDGDGVAVVKLEMPENLTAWKIAVWGMGQGTRVGSADREVVTSKNLLVRLQAPRFFVQTDEVVLSANVHNYLDEAKQVRVELDVDSAVLEPLVDVTQTIEIPAGGEQRVDWARAGGCRGRGPRADAGPDG